MPNSRPVRNRWFVVAGAVMVQLCLGVIYAWPVFTVPLVEAGWTRTQTQIVFSAQLAAFAVVMVAAGRLLPVVGPRALTMAGGLVLGLGYAAAGAFGGTSFPAIFVLVGLVGGAGIGLGYVVPIAVGMRWFPDRKGFITGLAVAGFGFGAMLWIKLADNWGHLLARHGIGGAFIVLGTVFAIVVTFGSAWMVFPPAGWKPPGFPGQPVRGAGARTTARDFTSDEMLGTPQYYMLLFTFAFSACAGLMAVGLLRLFPTEALSGAMKAAALAAGRPVDEHAILLSASAMACNAVAFFFCFANGAGRLIWGAVSDTLGRRRSIVAMLTMQGIMMFAFPRMASSEPMLYLGATLIGFNFGGNFALFPAMTADTFGAKHVGQNYGWVYLAYGIGGILGPVMGGKLGDLGNFPLAFSICGGLCMAAAAIATRLKPAIR